MNHLKLEELQLHKVATSVALSAIKSTATDYVRDRMDAYRDQVEADMKAKFGVELNEKLSAHNAAVRAFDDEVDRIARTGEGAPHPVGTRMIEWQYPRHNYRAPCQKTGKVGVIEVITRDSKHPKNLRWGRASVGWAVIRLLDTKGQPTLKYASITGYRTDNWHPEGVDPNVSKKPKLFIA